jgi:hypothetical protein
MSELPEHIKKAIQRKTELMNEHQGLLMINVYARDIDFQVEVNARIVKVRRELAEVEGEIERYIDAGKQPSKS